MRGPKRKAGRPSLEANHAIRGLPLRPLGRLIGNASRAQSAIKMATRRNAQPSTDPSQPIGAEIFREDRLPYPLRISAPWDILGALGGLPIRLPPKGYSGRPKRSRGISPPPAGSSPTEESGENPVRIWWVIRA